MGDKTGGQHVATRLCARVRRLAGVSFLREEGGAAAVEFTLVVLPFLLLVFATLQIGLIFFFNQSLQTAANRGARMVMTGETRLLNQATYKTAVCGNLPSFFNCANVMVDLKSASNFSGLNTAPITVTYSPMTGLPTNTWSFSPGGRGDVAILRVMYNWPAFGFLNFSNQSNGSVLMIGTAVVKNEPYS